MKKKERRENKRKENINQINNKINDILEIPKEISSTRPKLTIVGFEQILIENYKNILEYEDYHIKINTHIGIVNFTGYYLKLEQMTKDDIVITGKIDRIEFESIESEEREE